MIASDAISEGKRAEFMVCLLAETRIICGGAKGNGVVQ